MISQPQTELGISSQLLFVDFFNKDVENRIKQDNRNSICCRLRASIVFKKSKEIVIKKCAPLWLSRTVRQEQSTDETVL